MISPQELEAVPPGSTPAEKRKRTSDFWLTFCAGLIGFVLTAFLVNNFNFPHTRIRENKQQNGSIAARRFRYRR